MFAAQLIITKIDIRENQSLPDCAEIDDEIILYASLCGGGALILLILIIALIVVRRRNAKK